MENPYATLAVGTYSLYQAFIAAGFTEEQALDLTRTQYAFMVVNAQVDAERRAKRTSDLTRRFRNNGLGYGFTKQDNKEEA